MVFSVILKWKKLGKTLNLPTVACLAKLVTWERKVSVKEIRRNPAVSLKELQMSNTEIGEPVGQTTISAVLRKLGLYGIVARQKLLSEQHMTSGKMWKKILWSDKMKIELGGGENNTSGKKTGTAHHLVNTIPQYSEKASGEYGIGVFLSGRGSVTGND